MDRRKKWSSVYGKQWNWVPAVRRLRQGHLRTNIKSAQNFATKAVAQHLATTDDDEKNYDLVFHFASSSSFCINPEMPIVTVIV